MFKYPIILATSCILVIEGGIEYVSNCASIRASVIGVAPVRVIEGSGAA